MVRNIDTYNNICNTKSLEWSDYSELPMVRITKSKSNNYSLFSSSNNNKLNRSIKCSSNNIYNSSSSRCNITPRGMWVSQPMHISNDSRAEA